MWLDCTCSVAPIGLYVTRSLRRSQATHADDRLRWRLMGNTLGA